MNKVVTTACKTGNESSNGSIGKAVHNRIIGLQKLCQVLFKDVMWLDCAIKPAWTTAAYTIRHHRLSCHINHSLICRKRVIVIGSQVKTLRRLREIFVVLYSNVCSITCLHL
uniref:Uncharacterized protein n=1 Tax=Lygus hesperus TaxID=30085 RepID=A0A146KT28_LYGHE